MWIQYAKRASLTSIATSFDYEVLSGQSIRPCPSCGLVQRSRSDRRRGPVGFNRDESGWQCYQCGAKGDVVDFMAHHFFQRPVRELTKEECSVVRDWFAEKGYCTPSGVASHIQPDPSKRPVLNVAKPTAPHRPPFDELKSLWEATKTFEEAIHDAPKWSEPLNEWLVSRRFSPLILDKTKCVRVLPNQTEDRYPEWWPHQWGAKYRIVSPVFEMDGKFASIHCRSIAPKNDKSPKTRWPSGYEASGLLMANENAIHMMRGNVIPDIHGFLICEGITDFMRACEQAHRESIPLAIVAGTSGSFKAISKIKIPNQTKIFIGTDTDEQGDEYAALICDQLPEHMTYRLPLEV